MIIENLLLKIFMGIFIGVGSSLFVRGIYYLILKIKGDL